MWGPCRARAALKWPLCSLPFHALLTLPSASASQAGVTGPILRTPWNLSGPQALLRARAGPPSCVSPAVVAAEAPAHVSAFCHPSSLLRSQHSLFSCSRRLLPKVRPWLELHSPGPGYSLHLAMSPWGPGPEPRCPHAHSVACTLCLLAAHLPHGAPSFPGPGCARAWRSAGTKPVRGKGLLTECRLPTGLDSPECRRAFPSPSPTPSIVPGTRPGPGNDA